MKTFKIVGLLLLLVILVSLPFVWGGLNLEAVEIDLDIRKDYYDTPASESVEDNPGVFIPVGESREIVSYFDFYSAEYLGSADSYVRLSLESDWADSSCFEFRFPATTTIFSLPYVENFDPHDYGSPPQMNTEFDLEAKSVGQGLFRYQCIERNYTEPSSDLIAEDTINVTIFDVEITGDEGDIRVNHSGGITLTAVPSPATIAAQNYQISWSASPTGKVTLSSSTGDSITVTPLETEGNHDVTIRVEYYPDMTNDSSVYAYDTAVVRVVDEGVWACQMIWPEGWFNQ